VTEALTAVVNRLETMLLDLFRQLPNLLIGLLIFWLIYLLSNRVRAGVIYVFKRTHRSQNAGIVFGRLVRWVVILAGLLVALTIILPSFNPAQLIELLGISSVAIGFAFRDILQNLLAGILLLLTEPFKIGDQIVVRGYEGTVEDIRVRATYIITYDGRRVVIPNAALFTESVIVNTAQPFRRSAFDVGIGYGDGMERAKAIMLATLNQVEGVLSTPEPDVIAVGLAASSVTLRARWWTDSRRAANLNIQDKVIIAIKNALQANGIDLPFPTQQILFHDQTEETDGDRGRQREGWPAGTGEVPRPRPMQGRWNEEMGATKASSRHEPADSHTGEQGVRPHEKPTD